MQELPPPFEVTAGIGGKGQPIVVFRLTSELHEVFEAEMNPGLALAVATNLSLQAIMSALLNAHMQELIADGMDETSAKEIGDRATLRAYILLGAEGEGD